MNDPNNDNAVREFLGDDASMGGPFALLGLRYTPIDEGMILRARTRCLDRINAHPRSRTPLADEARLAVNAAASQLLDPALRTELAHHWPEGTGVRAPDAWDVGTGASRLDERLRHRARLILAACGGWNARARRRLSQFARSNRIPARELLAMIAHQSRAIDHAPSARPLRPLSVRADAPFGPAPIWPMLLGYGAMLLSLIATPWLSPDPPPNDAPVVVAQRAPADPGPMDRDRSDAQREAGTRRHHGAILHELGVIAQTPGTDPSADAIKLEQLISRFSARWTEFNADELDEAIRTLDAALGRFDTPTRREILVRALGEPRPDDPSRIMGDALLSRGEAHIDASLRDEFERRGSDPGISPAWWDEWLRALRSLSERDPALAGNLLKHSVGRTLGRAAIDPDALAAISERAVGAMDWGPDDGARIWLLGLLTDPMIESENLSVFVRAMLTHSSAPGLDTSMALRSDATRAEREELLESLRIAWRTGATDDDDIRVVLMNQIRDRSGISDAGLGDEGLMHRAVELARLNAACRRWALGDETGARLIASMLDDPVEIQAAPGQRADLSTSRRDQTITEQIWNARDADAIGAAIDRLWRADRIGPWSAHAVLHAALRAPDVELRERALMLAQRHASEPAMLIAMDRLLATDRPNSRDLMLVGAILENASAAEAASVDDDPATLRRRVHARLVGSGVLGDSGRYDALETALLAATALNLGSDAPGGVDGNAGADPVSVLRRIRERAESGVRRAGATVPDWIEARRVIGAANARGGLERYAAEHAAAFRATALWIWVRNPSLRERLTERIVALDESSRSARHALEQIVRTQTAMLEIWSAVLEMRLVS